LKITADNISKSYNNTKLFEALEFEIFKEAPLAILGKNGSGKSTLLKIIAGITEADQGNIIYTYSNKIIPARDIFRNISFIAPYTELIEEFTLTEMLAFQNKFYKTIRDIQINDILKLLELERFKDVAIKKFSSGMKQRLKIGLAVFFEKKILLFDEPCVNLDKTAIDWYMSTLNTFLEDRLLVVCSNNNTYEYYKCQEKINLDK